jgi:hypothetical protein
MGQRRPASAPRRSLRPVYAARLTLRPVDDAAGDVVYPKAVDLATACLTEAARRHRVEFAPEDLAADPAGDRPTDEPLAGEGERRGWRGTVEHPHQRVARVSLRTEVLIRPEPGGADLTLRQLVGAAPDGPTAEALRIDRPALVDDLFAAFAVSADNLPLSRRPRRYRPERIGGLVRRLTDPERAVPIVVVSKRGDGSTAVDASEMARRLAGIAMVVELADFATAFQLTERVGKELSCYEGAVRLYWPGFSPTADPYAHPLWLAAVIARKAPGDELSWLLLRQIGAVAVEHIGLELDVPAAAEPDRPARSDDLARQRRDAAASEAELWELLADASLEIQLLKDQIAELKRENDELWTTLAESPDLWQRMKRARERREAEEQRADLQQRIEGLGGLADAVRLAAEVHGGPHVEFIEAAFKSAEKAPFQESPRKAYEALAAICAVAERYHTDQLGKPFKQAFEELGQDYRGNVSQTALGQHGNHYTFTSSKGKIQVGPHLVVGLGNPRTSLRIYWHDDEAERRFIVCHVGEHLPDTTT